jgi:anti-sigma factor RsiW
MRAVHWRHGQLGYVLLGKDPQAQLTALARGIALP